MATQGDEKNTSVCIGAMGVDEFSFETFPQGQKFDVVYADIPFHLIGTKKVPVAVDNIPHPKINQRVMHKMPVKQLTNDNAVLFMWATGPKIQVAMNVMKAWGFSYKTVFKVWLKRNRNGMCVNGQGFYNRSSSEYLLLGIKGCVTNGLVTGKRKTEGSELEFPACKGKHKPSVFRDIIDSFVKPDAKKIELFARTCNPDWASWGWDLPDVFHDRGALIPEGYEHPVVSFSQRMDRKRNRDEVEEREEKGVEEDDVDICDTSSDSGNSVASDVPEDFPSAFERLDKADPKGIKSLNAGETCDE
jgi:N6-adenosine-specific RNA methylase IME4